MTAYARVMSPDGVSIVSAAIFSACQISALPPYDGWVSQNSRRLSSSSVLVGSLPFESLMRSDEGRAGRA